MQGLLSDDHASVDAGGGIRYARGADITDASLPATTLRRAQRIEGDTNQARMDLSGDNQKLWIVGDYGEWSNSGLLIVTVTRDGGAAA